VDRVVQWSDELATESLVSVPLLAWCVKATLLKIPQAAVVAMTTSRQRWQQPQWWRWGQQWQWQQQQRWCQQGRDSGGEKVGGNGDGNYRSGNNDNDGDSGGKMMTTGAITMVVAAAAAATMRTMVATAMAKCTKNNQIKEAIAVETAMAMWTAMVTVTMAGVTQQRQQRLQHIAGVVCLMKMQYFGWGGIGKVAPPLTFLPLMSC
jgi:hypothetical protein